MKKLYKVELRKTVTEAATIRVEAENLDAVWREAYKEVENDDWSLVTQAVTIASISEVEEEPN